MGADVHVSSVAADLASRELADLQTSLGTPSEPFEEVVLEFRWRVVLDEVSGVGDQSIAG